MHEKQTILIIEDTRELVDLLVRRFEQDYNTIFAMDGRGGIEKACGCRPDIILLDVNLPDMSGFDVLNELKSREETTEIPVLVMTALSDADNVLTGFKMGAEDYLVKPFNFTELSARVNAHLTIRKLQKKLLCVERLNTLKEIAVSFSHEINNPLMSISTFSHALKARLCNGDLNKDECIEMLDGITSEVGLIAARVKRLAEATRTASVDYQPGIKMIDMDNLAD